MPAARERSAANGGEPLGVGQQPGEEHAGQGPVTRAIGTSVRGNSTAFGFSIMITLSFGALSRLVGGPSLLELLLFGVSAAVAVAALEGIVTRGFRARLEKAPQEVQLLGTAMNFASVGAGVAVAIAVGEVIHGIPAWPVAGLFAASSYVLTESAEMLLSERIEAMRGDRKAGEAEEE